MSHVIPTNGGDLRLVLHAVLAKIFVSMSSTSVGSRKPQKFN